MHNVRFCQTPYMFYIRTKRHMWLVFERRTNRTKMNLSYKPAQRRDSREVCEHRPPSDTHTHTHTHTHTRARTHTQIHNHKHIHIKTHTQTHIHTYIHCVSNKMVSKIKFILVRTYHWNEIHIARNELMTTVICILISSVCHKVKWKILYQFIPNLFRNNFPKYDRNCSIFDGVKWKIKRVPFYLRHSVHIEIRALNLVVYTYRN